MQKFKAYEYLLMNHKNPNSFKKNLRLNFDTWVTENRILIGY